MIINICFFHVLKSVNITSFYKTRVERVDDTLFSPSVYALGWDRKILDDLCSRPVSNEGIKL